jgi:uncharacterized membrane protein YeaQ/YmgE (transglycosylase-associated protein family)
MKSPDKLDIKGGNVMRDDTYRHLVVFAVIGLIAGWLASLVVGGSGLLGYLVSGVLGAFVGGYLLNALKIRLPISNVWISQIVTSTIGAVVVVILAKLILN